MLTSVMEIWVEVLPLEHWSQLAPIYQITYLLDSAYFGRVQTWVVSALELPPQLPLRARLAARVLAEYGEITPQLRAIIEAITPEEDA